MIVTEGRDWLLSTMLGARPREDMILRLFRDNHSPKYGDRAQSFHEVSGGGYHHILLSKDGWEVRNGAAHFPDQQWEFRGPCGLVYGSYITTAQSNVLVAARKFDEGAFDIRMAGDRIVVPVALNWTGA